MRIERSRIDLEASIEELRDQREKSKMTEKEHWPLYDASLESFASEFRSVIPRREKTEDETDVSKSFLDYIGGTLDAKDKHLVAVEFGGPGVNLFGGFPRGFFKKTLGVSLEDSKNSVHHIQEDGSHRIIIGDLFHNDVYKKIRKELGDDSVDLIISRMSGGLDGMTSDPAIWGKIARTWYGMLSQRGLLFVQYRFTTGEKWISDSEIQKDVREKLMKEWAAFIRDHYGDTIEIQLSDYDFRLLKKDGAPKELPLLPSFDRSPIIKKI